MPALATIACVRSLRTAGARTTRSTRHYLCSADLAPERFATAVHTHWRVENSQHWALDVVFDEDRARNRKDNSPDNLAILRKLTLNVLGSARPKLADAFGRSIIDQMQ